MSSATVAILIISGLTLLYLSGFRVRARRKQYNKEKAQWRGSSF